MAELLKGAPAAAALTESLAPRAAALLERGVCPTLAMIRVGAKEDDLTYERAAVKRCQKAGIRAIRIPLPEDCTLAELLTVIGRVNRNDAMHGCLLFRPLPPHIDQLAVCDTIAPEKDVDGVNRSSLAGIFLGRESGYAPCTAQAVLELLRFYGVDPAGKNVVVIGRSLVVGKPLAMLLLNHDATVTLCHRKTADLPAICRSAEILVTAAGQAQSVDRAYTNPDQVVIDVGINALPGGGFCGDVNFTETEPYVRAITPVPGGIGAVTTSVLCKHVIEAAEKKALLRSRR